MLTALRIVHLLSATVWVGGTIVLVFVGVPAIRRLEGEARATAMKALGRRWRPLGWSAMGIAILSGLWLTDLHSGFNSAALSSDFDRTLILKSALVVLLVAGALVHDYALGPRLQQELRAKEPQAPTTQTTPRLGRLVQLRPHARRPDPRRDRPVVPGLGEAP